MLFAEGSEVMDQDDCDDYDDDYTYDGREQEAPRPYLLLTVLGIGLALGLVGGGLWAAVLLPALARTSQNKCANNLRQVGLAVLQYGDSERVFPHAAKGDLTKVLRDLRNAGYVDSPQDLGCPEVDGGASYEGFMAPCSGNLAGTEVVAWDTTPHVVLGQEMRNVLMADCTVKFVNGEEFALLKEKHDAELAKILAAQGPK